MLEVQIGQQFLSELSFIDEVGRVQTARLVYDWLPTTCTACRGMGHIADICRKGDGAVGTRRVWKPKVIAQQKQAQVGAKSKAPMPQKKQAGPQKATPPKTVAPSVPTPVVTPVVQRAPPVVMTKGPVTEPSMPRRMLTRLMRGDNAERRLFTPGGLSFMESLNLSLQKSKAGLMERVLFEKGESSNHHTDNGCHKGGRIWLIWDPGMFMVSIQEVTAQCIHAQIMDRGRNISFWLTMIYGLNKPAERDSLWQSLRKYHQSIRVPWITCGDFNPVMAIDERIGGAPVTLADINPLKQLVQGCDLYEFKGCGSFYTWTNKHEAGDKVYSRIDRVFTNEDWLNVFPGSYANFLPEGLFDHCPCLINFEEAIHNRKMPFKYFNMWASAPNFLETVQNSWGPEVRGNAMFTVVTKLKRLKNDFKALNKEQFSDIENLTRVAEMSLEHYQTLLREDPLNERVCQAESECAKEVRLLQQARNDYLQQKAKISWALDGDENSAVFHASIKKRRRKNKVF
ncbi:uncharacterized protein LOC141607580 [Silene latifolia]|uniref:uncharacterized protein LOC141607580 n=1 Tax=Silene latifolia TaxID=37657 RepID=UPI003D775502